MKEDAKLSKKDWCNTIKLLKDNKNSHYIFIEDVSTVGLTGEIFSIEFGDATTPKTNPDVALFILKNTADAVAFQTRLIRIGDELFSIVAAQSPAIGTDPKILCGMKRIGQE